VAREISEDAIIPFKIIKYNLKLKKEKDIIL
jgi:hypothetical protein